MLMAAESTIAFSRSEASRSDTSVLVTEDARQTTPTGTQQISSAASQTSARQISVTASATNTTTATTITHAQQSATAGTTATTTAAALPYREAEIDPYIWNSLEPYYQLFKTEGKTPAWE